LSRARETAYRSTGSIRATPRLGLDDVALFGFDTGKRLEQSDEQALRTGAPVTITERIFLKSQEHHFQITKVTLTGDKGAPQGIVSVFRDITTMVKAEGRKRLAISQTVEALVKAIEFTDPYLAGHSLLMRDVSSLLAESLHLSPEDKATVEMASNLSQIGKMFIDKAVLTKVEQLTDEEKHQVQKLYPVLSPCTKPIFVLNTNQDLVFALEQTELARSLCAAQVDAVIKIQEQP